MRTMNEGNILKDAEWKLLCELISNCRRSDRELARLIGVSQPTVTRIRTRLEQKGVIRYDGTPNLAKVGYEIIAITFGNWRREEYPDTRVSKAKDFLAKHPNIIFVSTGSGIGSDRVAISVHKDYAGYSEFMKEIKTDWGELMEITGSFIIGLKSDNILRPISMRYLAECIDRDKLKLLLKLA